MNVSYGTEVGGINHMHAYICSCMFSQYLGGLPPSALDSPTILFKKKKKKKHAR